jgi:hypothetical protein
MVCHISSSVLWVEPKQICLGFDSLYSATVRSAPSKLRLGIRPLGR